MLMSADSSGRRGFPNIASAGASAWDEYLRRWWRRYLGRRQELKRILAMADRHLMTLTQNRWHADQWSDDTFSGGAMTKRR